MTSPSIQQKAIEIMVIMNTAITNLRLYPPSSAMIVNTIDRLFQALLMILEQESPLIIAESERNILISGESLSKNDQERPQVKAFLELLLSFGIKSVTFEKGLDKRELLAFLEIMWKKPEAVKSEGGLEKLRDDFNLSHILLNKKIYIAKDEESQIIASLDIKDADIIQYMVSSNQELDLDPQRVKEMAKDPEWMTKIFQTGLTQIMQQKGALSNIQMSENLVHMIGILNKVVDKMDQEKMSQLVAKSVADLDVDMISLVLINNIDNLFDGKIFQRVLDQIDEEKFEGVVEMIHSLESIQAAKLSQSVIAGEEESGRILSKLMASDKGKQLRQNREEKEALEKSEKARHLMNIERDIKPILNRDENAFMNKPLMASLSDLVNQLTAYEEHQTVDTLIHRLAEELLSNNQNVRDEASEALVRIIDNLSERQKDIIRELLSTFIKWIKLETSVTSAYEKICRRLKDQIEECIRKMQFADCIPALDLFHLIATGELDKNDTAHAIASDIIRELAAPDKLDVIFEEFSHGEENTRDIIGRVLGRLGDVSLNRLLDLLRDHDDSNERIRILHIFAEIGKPCAPVIRERIVPDESWYFLRNLAYILGHINSSAIAAALEPLLLNNNEKVRQEALKSLYRAGGTERGPILLSILTSVDEPFKMDIIDMFGNLKYSAATTALIELLKTRPLVASASRIDLEEKICIALGKIGSQEAIPILKEIGRAKGFLAAKSYPGKVKNAAANALASISNI